jgi:hypothetical protein
MRREQSGIPEKDRDETTLLFLNSDTALRSTAGD